MVGLKERSEVLVGSIAGAGFLGFCVGAVALGIAATADMAITSDREFELSMLIQTTNQADEVGQARIDELMAQESTFEKQIEYGAISIPTGLGILAGLGFGLTYGRREETPVYET